MMKKNKKLMELKSILLCLVAIYNKQVIEKPVLIDLISLYTSFSVGI